MEVFDLSKVRNGFSQDAKGVGFAGTPSLGLTTDVCKWGYQKTWSDDAPEVVDMPVQVEPVPVEPLQNAVELTVPPKKKDDVYLNAVLIGLGVYLFLKIIE